MKKIFIIILVGLVFLSGCKFSDEDLLNINLQNHQNIQLHIHPFLEIEILGKPYLLQSNMGITNGVMKVIHTHDATGKLHVEATFPHQFFLGDFFTILGETFNSECIFDNCIDENHELLVFVDGVKSDKYEKVPLKDGGKIRIVYAKKN